MVLLRITSSFTHAVCIIIVFPFHFCYHVLVESDIGGDSYIQTEEFITSLGKSVNLVCQLDGQREEDRPFSLEWRRENGTPVQEKAIKVCCIYIECQLKHHSTYIYIYGKIPSVILSLPF